jgi:ABC-type bacteriocin/lantibiotic exporter with double-glycine peptidase domain
MENLKQILIGAILFITLIVIILGIIEKRIYKRIILKEGNRNKHYLNELKKIKTKNTKEALGKIDIVARGFFKEAFKIKNSKGYLEIKTQIKRPDKTIQDFSTQMPELLYSNETITQKQVNELTNLLSRIIRENHIAIKDE